MRTAVATIAAVLVFVATIDVGWALVGLLIVANLAVLVYYDRRLEERGRDADADDRLAARWRHPSAGQRRRSMVDDAALRAAARRLEAEWKRNLR